MMLKMYALKDQLNGFTPPFPMPNNEMAKRHFKELQEGNPTVRLSPKDFTMFYIGEFDSDTGQFTTEIHALTE